MRSATKNCRQNVENTRQAKAEICLHNQPQQTTTATKRTTQTHATVGNKTSVEKVTIVQLFDFAAYVFTTIVKGLHIVKNGLKYVKHCKIRLVKSNMANKVDHPFNGTTKQKIHLSNPKKRQNIYKKKPYVWLFLLTYLIDCQLFTVKSANL